MKKVLTGACTALLALTLAACNGGGGSDGSTTQPNEATPANDLETIIQTIQTDFSNTSQTLLDEQEKMFEEVGDTYEAYLENTDAVQEWYDLAVSETEALGERTRENCRDYYQVIVDTVDVTDDRELDKATDELYDAIYDDAFDDYYDAIYDDAFDDAYDQYYDGIIDEAYDVTPYDEWSDVRSDAYDAWSDARSDVYDAWSDARSDIYDDYSDVRSAFYDNDFDIAGLFGPVQTKDEGDGAQEAAETDGASDSDGSGSDATADDAASSDASAGDVSSSSASGVSADFKATMDGYEAFFDEYIEFMKLYEDDPTSADLLAQYSDFMSQYTDTMAAMTSLDTSELSDADYAYYFEVTGRIYEKLAEAGQ